MGQLVSFDDDGRRVTVRAVLPRGSLKPVLERIGDLMVYAAQRAIFEQKRGNVTWPPRRVPNVLGVLDDLAKGKSVDPARLEPRPALYVTGRLYRSFRARITGRTVRTISTAPYAQSMEEGGTKTIRLTPALKRRLGGWIPRQDAEVRRRFRGFLARDMKEVTVTWPGRPITGLPRDLRPKVVGLIRSSARRLSLGIEG